MGDLDTTLRLNAANKEAANLGDGYRIQPDLEPPNLRICTVRAYLISGDEPAGRDLCRTTSIPVDSVEEGLEVLRGIFERDQPWPDER